MVFAGITTVAELPLYFVIIVPFQSKSLSGDASSISSSGFSSSPSESSSAVSASAVSFSETVSFSDTASFSDAAASSDTVLSSDTLSSAPASSSSSSAVSSSAAVSTTCASPPSLPAANAGIASPESIIRLIASANARVTLLRFIVFSFQYRTKITHAL